MEPFIGQIMLFAGTFAPRNWAICDGRLLAIQDYTSLYSLLGTIYGGDGRTTFGLPDLRGKAPIGAGHGPGLTNRILGQYGGQEHVILSTSQMPSHAHPATMQATGHIMADSAVGEDDSPSGNSLAKAATDFYSAETPTIAMNAASVAVEGTVTVEPSGNNYAHANMQPFQAINYCICLNGLYPPRP